MAAILLAPLRDIAPYYFSCLLLVLSSWFFTYYTIVSVGYGLSGFIHARSPSKVARTSNCCMSFPGRQKTNSSCRSALYLYSICRISCFYTSPPLTHPLCLHTLPQRTSVRFTVAALYSTLRLRCHPLYFYRNILKEIELNET